MTTLRRLVSLLLSLSLAPYGAARAEEVLPLLTYALPSADVLYRRQSPAWFIDCAVSGACTVCFEVWEDEAMTRRSALIRKRLNGSGMFRITFTGVAGKKRLAAGDYHCRVYASGQEAQGAAFPLTIRPGSPEALPLAATGGILPEDDSDAAVWAAITAPRTVVRVGSTEHQPLYAEADVHSSVVGTVHGQSQGLEVVKVGRIFARVRAYRHEDGALVEGFIPVKRLKVVRPNTHYGLLIDKGSQTMTVYERGHLLGRMQISTGLSAPGKLFRETRAGAFMTTDRVMAFTSGGYRYECCIRIDGGNLLHQIGYDTDTGSFDHQLEELGRKASEGCVRMDNRAEAGGLNAWWIWTHLEYGTGVIVTE